MEIIIVFNIGEEDCQHDWSYDKPSSLSMTKPINAVGVRICRKCGRMERFTNNELIKADRDFKKVFEKFTT